ncbi:MAG: nucleotidyltransferase [Cyclobacterium sp.]|uniref:nucleotidyltransferase n=1 Tax=unclassified Cyclobacterium TaxID=2615055 RepID=UPI0013CF9943|nr:nucleotidyltransferase [Cyclobacterium sp. SYSU L10401]
MNQNNRFPEDFRSFIESLNKHGVEYLLIGGFAMGAYGYIRSTGDLDIFIHATEENAQRALKACIDFGIDEADLKEEMFLVEKMIGIGMPPLRIEILKKLDTIDFKYAYQRAETKSPDGLEIKIVALDDLILLKEAAVKGRNKERDREDLAFLKQYKNKLNPGK